MTGTEMPVRRQRQRILGTIARLMGIPPPDENRLQPARQANR